MSKVVDWSSGQAVLRDMTPQEIADVPSQSELIVQAAKLLDFMADTLIDEASPARLQRIAAAQIEMLKAYKLLPVNPPSFLTGEAARRGITTVQCADDMLAEISAMDRYLVAVDEIRTDAVYRINQTTTADQIPPIFLQAVISLQTLTP